MTWLWVCNDEIARLVGFAQQGIVDAFDAIDYGKGTSKVPSESRNLLWIENQNRGKKELMRRIDWMDGWMVRWMDDLD